jgi:hypothetical protein
MTNSIWGVFRARYLSANTGVKIQTLAIADEEDFQVQTLGLLIDLTG